MLSKSIYLIKLINNIRKLTYLSTIYLHNYKIDKSKNNSKGLHSFLNLK